MKKVALWLHSWLFGFYPRDFRHEFGEEVTLTFRDVIDDAFAKGRWALLKVLLLELKDFPLAVFYAHLFAMQENTGGQTMFHSRAEKNWKIESQREAWLAALPPLVFGFGFALGMLIIREPWQNVPPWRMGLGLGMLVLACLVLAVGAFRALWQKIPNWGYSWIGYAYMGLILFIKTFAEEQADFGLPMVSPLVDQIIAVVVLGGMALFLGIAILHGWQQAGLLSFGYAGMMALSLFGMLTAAPIQRLDLALFILPASLLMAWLTYLYVRSDDLQKIPALLGSVLLYSGIVWLVMYAWQSWYLERGANSPILPLFVIFMILLLSGPLGGILGTPLRRAFHAK